MPEIEREELLAQRQEELQRITDKRNLDQMLKAQKAGDGDSISKAAKRASIIAISSRRSDVFPGQHTIRGATKEKSRKLDELKAKRKAKDERKRVCPSASRSFALSQSCSRLEALRSATGRHLPWRWKPTTTKQKTDKSPNMTRRKKKNVKYLAWRILTTNL